MKHILEFICSASIVTHLVFAWLMVSSYFSGNISTDGDASLFIVRLMVWLIVAGPAALIVKTLVYSDPPKGSP